MHIPFFHEVLLESFSCDHCGKRDSTIKPAGRIQEKGLKFTFRLESEADLQRQVMRNDSSIFKIEDLGLEMPPRPGQLTNLEGLISHILADLQAGQAERKENDPVLFNGLESVIQQLPSLLQGSSFPFTVSLDDPSGNSSIEPSPSDKGAKYTRTEYIRTSAQNAQLGISAETSAEPTTQVLPDPMRGVNVLGDEVYEIPSPCPGCRKDCTVKVKKVNIPHFKEVVIMSTVCENCGFTTREVKTGGEIPNKGARSELRVKKVEDLTRDMLKSETCSLRVPELELEVQAGTLGGQFTTVEGILTQIRDQLQGQVFDAQTTNSDGKMPAGDSMPEDTKEKWAKFFAKLEQAIKAEIEYSIILEDPLANSYVQSLEGEEPEKAQDERLTTERYDRTGEENEELGLTGMRTESPNQEK